MVDMLVKLYDLPEAVSKLPEGISVRRAHAAEKSLLTAWVADHFSRGWADECEAAFCRLPVSCFLAVAENEPVGFCVHDTTAWGMAGPIGLAPAFRGKGIGRVLLLAALTDMRVKGYAYGVIGWVASTAFFARSCGATVIDGSDPGLYRSMLKSGQNKISGENQ